MRRRLLINTQLQLGVGDSGVTLNRFNGFVAPLYTEKLLKQFDDPRATETPL